MLIMRLSLGQFDLEPVEADGGFTGGIPEADLGICRQIGEQFGQYFLGAGDLCLAIHLTPHGVGTVKNEQHVGGLCTHQGWRQQQGGQLTSGFECHVDTS